MTPFRSPHFVAYEKLGQTPNIVVDGSGTPATEITLSHWPKSGTPRALKADTSTEIVFNYLATPRYHVAAAAVSNNHFDEDGLAGIYALIEPEVATAARELLIDVAHAGDFATYRHRQAARVAFTLSAFADPEHSPLDRTIFDLDYAEQCAALYEELLPRFGEMVAETDRFEDYWAAEDQFLTASEDALRRSEVNIEERPDVDLAIVQLPEGRGSQSATPVEAACHPMAIHNATRCNRILVQQGRRYVFRYRYESWVQLVSRRPPPRVDLTPLAHALSADEPATAHWEFDGVSAIAPRLRLSGDGESAIAPKTFMALVAAYLETAPPAWDPYDPP